MIDSLTEVHLPPLPKRYPCQMPDRPGYSNCIGFAPCAALGTDRCWDGRPLSPAGPIANRVVRIDEHVMPRTSAECKTCAHVVDEPGSSRCGLTLVLCARGRWYGAISVGQMVNGRIPLREGKEPPCPDYQRTEALRPEVEASQQRNREAMRTRRQLLRESRAKKASQDWGEVL